VAEQPFGVLRLGNASPGGVLEFVERLHLGAQVMDPGTRAQFRLPWAPKRMEQETDRRPLVFVGTLYEFGGARSQHPADTVVDQRDHIAFEGAFVGSGGEVGDAPWDAGGECGHDQTRERLALGPLGVGAAVQRRFDAELARRRGSDDATEGGVGQLRQARHEGPPPLYSATMSAHRLSASRRDPQATASRGGVGLVRFAADQ
jgi:hypothetical protein